MLMTGLRDSYRFACETVGKVFAPRLRLSVSGWADRFRRLPQKGASEPGQWHTDRTPFLREIMDALSADSHVRRVVFMKSSQVGGTEAGNNWLGYVIDHDPGPMMVVQPTLKVASRWAKQRLEPMIKETPALASKIVATGSRDGSNTAELKDFPGGVVIISGANSASSLRSMPAKYLFLDEVDAYVDDLDGEGSPIDLAERRTTTFPRRKILLVSTPTVRDASAIEAEYEASDQRRYHVPCPHCGELQWLQWKGLRWCDNDGSVQVPVHALTRAWYVCEHCDAPIEENHKTAMLARGQWVPGFPERTARGYHINALYTPIGLGDSWLDHARGWIRSQGNPMRLKVFINTVLGETWEERRNAIKHDELKARAEPFRLRTVPAGCLLLTCGVDTQDDRLAVQLMGHGRNGQIWILDWFELPGIPSDDALWARFDLYRTTPIRNQWGIDMRIEMTAIDTGGHFTHFVYNYCRMRQNQGVLAIKGASQANKPILGKPGHPDVLYQGETITAGVQLWPVGTDTAKTTLMSYLVQDRNAVLGERRVHFSDQLPDEYYQQLTAEKFDPLHHRWVKPKNARNEALDTAVYAMAAAQHPAYRIHVATDADWERREALLQPRMRDLFAEPAPQLPEPPPPADVPVAQPTSRRPVPSGASSHPATDDWVGETGDYWRD
ncbi:phage terminase large subunit family protein [Jeongeupia chitinilytica]|uniref:Terminase n=1 Tax=Jeongeupia chitinilytica TaxID=1041641 RepID=A0ABQ3H0J2_9NEIS|nr:phage terminase large subunit family protein [Jeongeupia chitinilytica]GHD60354.1 terminase [Jeongeupia chitinilytica]